MTDTITPTPHVTPVTPAQAAQALCAYLHKEGYSGARVWTRADFERTEWTMADAGVCYEGGPDMADLQLGEHGPFAAGCQPWPGVFCEPYSSWLMCFYADK